MNKKILTVGLTAVAISPTFLATQAHAASIDDIISQAVPVANANNIYPSVAIAQAILESGGGSSYLATHYNNIFGVKWTSGEKAALMTKEVINGKWVDIVQNFQVYPSFSESFQSYARLIRNNSIYSGTWRENTLTYKDATAWLQGRYATDTGYASKLNSVIAKYNLTQYDSQSTNKAQPENVELQENKPATPTIDNVNNSTNYTVKSGDTLGAIASKFNTTAEQLATWNSIKNVNTITIGQIIQIKNIKQVNVEKSEVTATTTETTTPDSAIKSNNTTQESINLTNATTYLVKSGDSLSRISKQYGISVTQIASWNNIKNINMISIGQILKIKNSASTPTQTETKPQTTNTEKQTRYTVKSGDTLNSIASQYEVSSNQIATWNNIKNINLIYIGQDLLINTRVKHTDEVPLATPNSKSKKYIVQKNESLSLIALKNNTTVAEIAKVNNISNVNFIVTGQILTIA